MSNPLVQVVTKQAIEGVIIPLVAQSTPALVGALIGLGVHLARDWWLGDNDGIKGRDKAWRPKSARGTPRVDRPGLASQPFQ